MTKKLLLPVAVAVVVLGAGLVWAWHARQGAADPDQLTLYGNVDIRQVSLAFNGSERIVDMRVQEGDRVKAGDLLGVLELRTTRLRLAAAEAQIGVQEQALKRLRSGSRPQEIDQARAALAAADAEADHAARQLARLDGTSEATAGKGVSRQDLDNALAHLQVARAQAESARKQAQLVEAGPRREDIAQAEKQLAYAGANLALVQRQIEESELRAPVDAVVRARLLEPGDMASPQRPAYTLAILQPKWVRAYVAEPQLGRIRSGMAASIQTDGAPGRSLPAHVGYISSVAEFTPKSVQTPELRTSLVYEVRLLVDDPQDELRLGMPATVRLALPSAAADAPTRP